MIGYDPGVRGRVSTESSVTTVERLESVGVATRRVAPSAVPDAVAAAIEPPAVGVSFADGEAGFSTDEAGFSMKDAALADAGVTVDPTGTQLDAARTGVTPASLCVADYGTVVLPARSDGSELVSLFVDRHVVVLRERDVVPDMETAFERFGSGLENASESRILATGPSATADMGELVVGAHGPESVIAIVVTGADA